MIDLKCWLKVLDGNSKLFFQKLLGGRWIIEIVYFVNRISILKRGHWPIGENFLDSFYICLGVYGMNISKGFPNVRSEIKYKICQIYFYFIRK